MPTYLTAQGPQTVEEQKKKPTAYAYVVCILLVAGCIWWKWARYKFFVRNPRAAAFSAAF